MTLKAKELEENISFIIFMLVFMVLSFIHSIIKYKLRNKSEEQQATENAQMRHVSVKYVSKAFQECQINVEKEQLQPTAIHSLPNPVANTSHDESKIYLENQKNSFIKSVLNYCVKYNSAVLIVGGLAESYLYGIRVICNVLSIFLGFLYAIIFIHPFMRSLKDEIHTPYEYFQKRYRNKTCVRVIVCLTSQFYYFTFLTLYLWGTVVVLSTILTIPFWASSCIIGVYSLMGSLLGGFTQSTKINIFQFLCIVLSFIVAIVLSLYKIKHESLSQLWTLAKMKNRVTVFDLHKDLTTKFTIFNQLICTPLPWAALAGLFLPNFKRYNSKNNEKKCNYVFLSDLPFMVIVNTIVFVSGSIVCFIFFFGCDPLGSQQIQNKNQIGVYWLHLILGKNIPILGGLLFSSLLFYSLVQHSSGISLCATTIFNEVLTPALHSEKFDKIYKHYIKNVFISFLSILSVFYSIYFHNVRNTMLSMLFFFNNAINSPILGLFLVSVLNPWANYAGVLLAFTSNVLINLTIGLSRLSFNKLVLQEFKPNTLLCTNNTYLNQNRTDLYVNASVTGSSSAYFDKQYQLLLYEISHETQYSNLNSNYTVVIIQSQFEEFLLSLFSITTTWYCLFSVLFTFVFGSLFSLLYSCIKDAKFDTDSDFSEERKKYLYYYRFKYFYKSK